MPCPTCDHTMEYFAGGGMEDERNRWFCPRCGTVKVTEDGIPDEVYVPKLVERCREFGETLVSRYSMANAMDVLRNAWQALGISESINLPENRP